MSESPDPMSEPPKRRSCTGRIGSVISTIVVICIAAVILISIKVFFFVFLNWLRDSIF